MTGPLDEMAEPEPKRDRWGRPLIPDPDTGEVGPYTRVTTFAKSISDSYGLTKWQLRQALKGVTIRPDLFALAAATPSTDSKTLDRVAEDAKEAAGSSSGANAGTAFHSFAERVDRGEDVAIPPPWDRGVASYRRALAAGGLEIDRRYIERMVVIPELQCAGTFDRLLRTSDGRMVVGDIKTQKDMAFGHLEIAIQLALYAHGRAIYNTRLGVYEPMPEVDRDVAVVMHCPVATGVCTLHAIDIAAGWEAARLCGQVRDWRARRDLSSPWPVNIPVPDLGEALTRDIAKAVAVGELEDLWSRAEQAGLWTDQHTQAARERKQQLLAS